MGNRAKIPVIKYPENRESTDNWVIAIIGEGGLSFHGDDIIWCYSEKQVKQIVDYYLEHGEIRIIYDKEIWGREVEKHFVFDSFDQIRYDKGEYPSKKLKVWKQIARVRKRPKDIGGNLKEGEFFDNG